MKKYLSLFVLVSLSVFTRAQNNPELNDCIKYKCYVQGLDFGTYFDDYRVFTEKEFDIITMKFDVLLNCKDIQICRDRRLALDSWLTLMRIQDIEWTNHKKDILNYLKHFLKQILIGNSYLNDSNKNIFYDADCCPYTNGDPISLPPACYGVVMKLDVKYGAKMIEETWELISKDEPFENSLRDGILNLLNINFKSSAVRKLLKKLEKTKIPANEIQKIREIEFKYELSKSKNQTEAWEKLVSQKKAQLNKSFSIENKQLWEKNIEKLEQLFGYKLEVNAPLVLAEKEKDIVIKNWLAYSTCFIENGNYPNKSDEAIINRIHKLVVNIQSKSLKEISKQNSDYLDKVYTIFQKWH